MQGAVSLRDLAAMPEDQHAALAAWVADLQRDTARVGHEDCRADVTTERPGDTGPLLDFEAELRKD